jgi:hypothetical protein
MVGYRECDHPDDGRRQEHVGVGEVRRALLVGIDDYPDAPLAGCVADANAVHNLLRSHANGDPNFDCQVVTAPAQVITKASLRSQIRALLAQPADIALFYFSGHGTENNLGGYLVTPDASQYDEGVPMVDLLTLANGSPVREVVLIIDCCNSGALGALPAVRNDQAVLREGVSVLTATRATENAIEVNGEGLFTGLLCDGLAGGASDVLGNVTIAGLYAYVDESLSAWEQRPLLKAHVSNLLSLRSNQPAVPLAELRLLPRLFPDPDLILPLDPSYEPTEQPQHAEHEADFLVLQHCRAAKLIEPVGEEHLYYAAMRSTGCRLTALGRHYWRLANSGRL